MKSKKKPSLLLLLIFCLFLPFFCICCKSHAKINIEYDGVVYNNSFFLNPIKTNSKWYDDKKIVVIDENTNFPYRSSQLKWVCYETDTHSVVNWMSVSYHDTIHPEWGFICVDTSYQQVVFNCHFNISICVEVSSVNRLITVEKTFNVYVSQSIPKNISISYDGKDKEKFITNSITSGASESEISVFFNPDDSFSQIKWIILKPDEETSYLFPDFIEIQNNRIIWNSSKKKEGLYFFQVQCYSPYCNIYSNVWQFFLEVLDIESYFVPFENLDINYGVLTGFVNVDENFLKKYNVLCIPNCVSSIRWDDKIWSPTIDKICFEYDSELNKIDSFITPDYSINLINTIDFSNCHLLNSIPANFVNGKLYSVLKNLFFPDELEEIGENAFIDCSSLSFIKIPVNLKIVNNKAFQHNNFLNLDFSVCKHLKQICSSAFCKSDNLLKITFPDSCFNTLSIEDNAFLGCRHLKSVSFPKTLTEFGKNCFDGCSSIYLLEFNDVIFSDLSFNNCTQVQIINFNCSQKHFNFNCKNTFENVGAYTPEKRGSVFLKNIDTKEESDKIQEFLRENGLINWDFFVI